MCRRVISPFVGVPQVTLNGLSVSADSSSMVLDGSDSRGLVGQEISFSEGSSSINYWLFILAAVLLLVLWLCCFCWVRGHEHIMLTPEKGS